MTRMRLNLTFNNLSITKPNGKDLHSPTHHNKTRSVALLSQAQTPSSSFNHPTPQSLLNHQSFSKTTNTVYGLYCQSFIEHRTKFPLICFSDNQFKFTCDNTCKWVNKSAFLLNGKTYSKNPYRLLIYASPLTRSLVPKWISLSYPPTAIKRMIERTNTET